MYLIEPTGARRLRPAEAARQTLATLEASGVEWSWIHLGADRLNDKVLPAVDYRVNLVTASGGQWQGNVQAASGWAPG